MPDRKRGTSIRPLARVLDSTARPAWLIDADGNLAYLSAACESWLGIDLEQLLGRSTRAAMRDGVSRTEAEEAALALAPPPGLAERGRTHHDVQPPSTTHRQPSLPVLFVALDDRADHVLALAGYPVPLPISAEQAIASEIQRQLVGWQQRQPALLHLAVTMGESSLAERLRRQCLVAAATREHLLLIGPAGCGSESAARAIHGLRQIAIRKEHELASGEPAPLDRERRCATEAPIIIVDGALMDAELLDATVAPAVHRLTESNTASVAILLRDVEQMPLDAQGRLDQIGDQFAQRMQLIALSTLPLEAMISEQRITAALAARLSALAISFPGLADRAGDIPMIATAMLERRRRQGEGRAERFNRQTLDLLVSYPWPRNIVELDAAVRHAIRNARGPAILPEHLPLAIRSYAPSDPSVSHRRLLDLDAALQKLERQLVTQALDRAAGNRAEAARLLNISRGRLLRRLEEWEAEEGEA